MYKVDFNKLEWESPIKGVRCKILRHDTRQLRLVEYTREMPLHWCEKGHIGYILEDQLEIEHENRRIIYQAGNGVFIPGGKKHQHKAKVLTDIVRVIFVEDV